VINDANLNLLFRRCLFIFTYIAKCRTLLFSWFWFLENLECIFPFVKHCSGPSSFKLELKRFFQHDIL
jgi:hypothetical protein